MLARNEERYLSTAETAAALGVTPRALRLYERKGLVKPTRTVAGWRAYGPEALARLHQILALKRFGFSLAAIGQLLAGRLARLESVLELQEQALEAQRCEAEKSLALVRAARARLQGGGALSLDELATLTRETTMTKDMPEWAKDMQPIVDKHFTQADKDAWAKRAGSFDQAKVSAEWEQLIAEAKSLLGTDPSSPKAIDLARRWREMSTIKSGADAATTARIREVWKEALADPKLAPKLPFDKAVWDFLAEAAKHLPKQG